LKRIAILGSTGSIGTQTLEVVKNHPDEFQVEVLTTGNNAELLIKQAIEFNPNSVVICNKEYYTRVKEALLPYDIKVFAGEESLTDITELESIDIVLVALVGFSGLKPTIRAIEYGKQIALATKEVLVVAGDIVTNLAKEKGVNIYPVDSEHSAIFQCIVGEEYIDINSSNQINKSANLIEKIYLTASGGPFRGKRKEDLLKVTNAEALNHPNWNMGAKVTIDSATLMNKGLEVIEAKWLFNLNSSQIEVIVHPQSIIHSIVQFKDGSMKAQMGLPNMKLPILYALSYPKRLRTDFKRFNFINYPQLTFEQPDTKNFRNLALAYDALYKGGNMPCVMNAANEVAVNEFIKGRISFLKMSDIVEKCMKTTKIIEKPTLEDYILTDKMTREKALSFI
jgi:1-deoxy-D-xylulose-5-phosphate reductoisomerase